MPASFLATDAAPSWSAGTRTARPASSPSVATSTRATSSLRPGMPFQRAATARRPVPSSRQLLGDLRRRGGQRHVAQVEGRYGRFRRYGVPTGRGGDRRLGTLSHPGPHCRARARPARRRRGAPPSGSTPSSSRSVRTWPPPCRGPTHRAVRWSTSTSRGTSRTERDDAGVGAGQLLVGRQVLAQLRRQRVQVGEDPVEVAVVGQELGRGLLPHARHARQVVRGVAPERRQEDVLRRRHPCALEDARLVVERVVADARACCRARARTGPARAGSCRGRR